MMRWGRDISLISGCGIISSAQFPLSKRPFQPNSLSLVLNDELHVNFGKQIIYNYFDQNRFFTGFNYHVNKHDNLQFGYMYLFQQLASGNRYRNNTRGPGLLFPQP
jgi:hypothetical protein